MLSRSTALQTIYFRVFFLKKMRYQKYLEKTFFHQLKMAKRLTATSLFGFYLDHRDVRDEGALVIEIANI